MDDRETYLSSRDNVIERSWVTELWMRVIQKAIDDLALFTRMHEDGETLTEEDKMYADTAYSFLFNPEYTVTIGNIEITVEELISIWGCENPERWRDMLRDKIKKLVVTKRKAVETRRRRAGREE